MALISESSIGCASRYCRKYSARANLAAVATANPIACPITKATNARVKTVTPEFSTANPLTSAMTKMLSAMIDEMVLVICGVVTGVSENG